MIQTSSHLRPTAATARETVDAEAFRHFREAPLTHARVRDQARKVLGFLNEGEAYSGEVFLCGGAYKPLLNPNHPIKDADLWVRDRKERERLAGELIARGACLVRDFQPYCMLFDLRGNAIEITYDNAKDRSIAAITGSVDLAGCAIAAKYANGQIVETSFSERAAISTADSQACLEDGYLSRLVANRLPTVLRSIDRLRQFARQMGYAVSASDLAALWAIYRNVYTRAERDRCIDAYLETTVGYNGIFDESLLETAHAYY